MSTSSIKSLLLVHFHITVLVFFTQVLRPGLCRNYDTIINKLPLLSISTLKKIVFNYKFKKFVAGR